MVFEGDPLRPEHFLDGHRKKRAGLHGRVVGDNHDLSVCDRANPNNDPRGRRSAPILVHVPGGPQSKLEEGCMLVNETSDTLAGGEAIFAVLTLAGGFAAALLDLGFLTAE